MRYQPLAYCSGRLVVETVEDGCRAGAADRLCIENPVRDRLERSVRVPVRRDMNSLLLLKRPFVWLRRFRHRRGYGVHSPFAFDFITRVVYEHTPYYQYKELSAEQRRLASEKGHSWACRESQKVKRLLFRLVNRAQPTFIVSVGPDSAAELYMKAAKRIPVICMLPSWTSFFWNVVFLSISFICTIIVSRRWCAQSLMCVPTV